MKRNVWDFCLVSQHVTQGTVSPTHYIIVHDGGMKPDNLQKLTYKMTMMYWNWTGTVRVPASCQASDFLYTSHSFFPQCQSLFLCCDVVCIVRPQAGIFGGREHQEGGEGGAVQSVVFLVRSPRKKIVVVFSFYPRYSYSILANAELFFCLLTLFVATSSDKLVVPSAPFESTVLKVHI